jgi:ribosome maturation protein Sdo1
MWQATEKRIIEIIKRNALDQLRDTKAKPRRRIGYKSEE